MISVYMIENMVIINLGDIMFKKPQESTVSSKETTNNSENRVLDKSLSGNISIFKNIFKDDETLIIREFENKGLEASKCCIIYLDGMVNNEVVNENIIQPVICSDLSKDIESDNLLEELKNKVIVSNNVALETEIKKIVSSVIYGDTLFLLEGYNQALVISSKGWQSRPISEPDSARVVRGPREGFTEINHGKLVTGSAKNKRP